MAVASSEDSPHSKQTWEVGQHSLSVESPQVLHIHLVGELHGPELALIMKHQNEWAQTVGRYFVLGCVEELTAVARDARPVLKEHLWPSNRAELVIVYGASFAMRTIGEMVVRARRVLNSTDPVPTTFVATEADARRLLASLLNKPVS